MLAAAAMFLLLMVPVTAQAKTRDETATQNTAAGTFASQPARTGTRRNLPFTGSDARAVAMLGAALVMLGALLVAQPSAPSGTSSPTSS
jgi:hypothetical protein